MVTGVDVIHAKKINYYKYCLSLGCLFLCKNSIMLNI